VRLGGIAVFAVALAACGFWVGVSADSPPSSSQSMAIAYTSTPQYAAAAWLQGGERFPAGARIMIRDGGVDRLLVSGFTATADPSISFDGARILFAGKREAKDSWQVWEVAVAGGEAKRITACDGDCVRPFYLPGGKLAYARQSNHRYLLETAGLEGGVVTQLTYALGNVLPTDVLRDGRILFEAAYPLGSGTSPEIYTVYSDGSGVESYRCDHGPSRQAGRQVTSGDVVFSKSDGLSRFTSALAHDVDMTAPAGEFAGDVVETPTHEYLVSWRPDSKAPYALQIWNPRSNSVQPLVALHDASIVQPVLIGARPVPNQHPSGLHDWNYANLLCLNTYTSKYTFAAGAITSMRLYTKSEAGKTKLLGGSRIEPDGSFYVRVPADQPLQIELLGRDGKPLKREQGWFWMRKGEQRICVGCHSGPERAPENAVPAVLVKSTTPVDLTGSGTPTYKGGR